MATAVALRAMAAALDAPDQALRTVTNVFAAPVRSGPVEVDVTILRRGRTLSQLTATMRNPGAAAGHTSVAVFGGPRPGFEFTDRVLPDVPAPDDCPSFRDPLPEGVEIRGSVPLLGARGRHGPRSAIRRGRTTSPRRPARAYWMRFDDPPILEDGTFDPFALVTLCDTQPGAVGERMGSNVPMWLPPSVDLTVHVFGVPTSEWLLAHNRAHYAGDGYASAEIELVGPGAGADRLRDPDHAVRLPRWPADAGQVRPPA